MVIFTFSVDLLVVLHSLLLEVIPHPSVSYRRVYTPILYFSLIILYGFEWVFFTHRRFLPYAPSPTFYLRLSRPPSDQAVLPWSLQSFILILETQRPGQSVCLIQSNLQSSYSERFIFKFYQTLSRTALVKV